jgi:hypothetical protein
MHVLGFCIESFSMFVDFEVFNLHYVSMLNLDNLKILDSWSLKFSLCWFIKFLNFELF